MLENITNIDLKVLSLYVKDYNSVYSIREITKKLKINYSHAFKRINKLVKQDILLKKRNGQVNSISLNLNIDTVQLLSFVEQQESKNFKNNTLRLFVKEAISIDPFVCIGVFGSRASGKAKKDSDWDVFIITTKRKEIERITTRFPHVRDIQLQVFSISEFEDSLMSREETVVKHIIKNKKIIYNPYPFYNIILNWEMIKYAPES